MRSIRRCRMRGSGREVSKPGERKFFNEYGGFYGGGGTNRATDSMRGRFSRDSRGRGTSFRGQDRSGASMNMSRNMGGGGYRGGNSLKGKQPGAALRKPTWDMSALQPFAKDFYKPHPRVQNRYWYFC